MIYSISLTFFQVTNVVQYTVYVHYLFLVCWLEDWLSSHTQINIACCHSNASPSIGSSHRCNILIVPVPFRLHMAC